MADKISVVVPTYNEAENIEDILRKIDEVLAEREFEILVVDDNSPDGTAEIVRKVQKDIDEVRLMVKEGKSGIGAAYTDGFDEVDGDILLQMDADFSHPAESLKDLIEEIDEYEVVIGSRNVEGGDRKDSILRHIPANIGSFLYTNVLGSPVKDITSGFKAYKSECKKFLTASDNPSGYSYQPYTLMKLVWEGYNVVEIPIDFKPRRAGEAKFSLLDIIDNVFVLLKLLKTKFFRKA